MSVEDLYSTFKGYKNTPPRCRNPAGALPKMARKVIEFLHCAREDLDIDVSFKRFPRHSQGSGARPTAIQLATFIYPDMHHTAAVIQYERDVLVIAKAYYVQEERRQIEAAERAWAEYARLVRGEPERTEEEEAEYNSVREEVFEMDDEGDYDADDEGDDEEMDPREERRQFEEILEWGFPIARR